MAVHEKIIQSKRVTLSEHTWYHICQSWDASLGYTSLYLNGELVGEEFHEPEVLKPQIHHTPY